MLCSACSEVGEEAVAPGEHQDMDMWVSVHRGGCEYMCELVQVAHSEPQYMSGIMNNVS